MIGLIASPAVYPVKKVESENVSCEIHLMTIAREHLQNIHNVKLQNAPKASMNKSKN
jgi:hypothetical protein